MIDWSKPLEVVDKETGECWPVECVTESQPNPAYKVVSWNKFRRHWPVKTMTGESDLFLVVNATEAK